MERNATPNRRGPRRSLDIDRIVRTALDLLDEDGSTTPSIRGVAARLGVRPNTLYTYVPDRSALEREIVDHLLAAADPALLAGDRDRGPAPGSGSGPGPDEGDGGGGGTGPAGWRARVEAYACALRDVLLERPGAVPLFFTGPMDGPNAAQIGESLLEIFTMAGLKPAEASRAAYAVIVHVLGSVALAVADRPTPHTTEAELVAARLRQLAGIDPEAWPLTAATAETAATWNSADQFRWGLHRLLDGCTAGPAEQAAR